MTTNGSAASPPKNSVLRRRVGSAKHEMSAAATATPQPNAEAPTSEVQGWHDVLSAMRSKSPLLASVFACATLLRFGPDRVVLSYAASHVLVKQATDASAVEQLLAALSAHFGQTPELTVETAPQVDPLRESLRRARLVAPQLAAATDAVNAALVRVEQALAALNLGVAASINLDPNPSRNEWQQWLQFGKDGSTWRLMLESGPDCGDEEDYSQSPLLSASKEVRLRAIERLPALVDRLVEIAEGQVTEFRSAAAKANALAEAIAEAK